MSPWEILGLNKRLHDKRTIKRAYAQRLKTTKPDEDPVGFRALYEAYQFVLHYSEDQSDENERLLCRPTHIPNGSLSQASPSVDYNADSIQPDTKVDAESVLFLLEQQVQEALNAPEKVNEKAHWFFLFEIEEVAHGNINPALRQKVFELVASYNLEHLKQGERNNHHIRPAIVKFLDDVFFWSDCREEYAELVAEDKFRAVFDLLDYYQNQVSSEKSIIGGKLNKQDDNVFSTHAGRVFFVLSILMFVVLLFIDL